MHKEDLCKGKPKRYLLPVGSDHALKMTRVRYQREAGTKREVEGIDGNRRKG